MCTIEGCARKPVAKGLCAKHYMRDRRTGDANRVRKAGRKKSKVRSLMPEGWSPRTCTRFVHAMDMLWAACDQGEVKRAIEAATRPNGSLNVSKPLDIAFIHYQIG